jgi:peptide/nickel transport system substrate-binding protein
VGAHGVKAGRLAIAVLAAQMGAPACQPAPDPAPPRPLRIVVAADLPNLDPQSAWDEVSSAVLGNVFDTLVRFDASLRVGAGVARSWISLDDRTWRFRLDERARFHDGTPVRAADIIFSIERQQTLTGSGGQVFARQVSAVSAIDESTVDVTTAAPAALLANLAAIPVLSRRHAESDPPGARAVGSGPYRVVSWEPGRRLLLEASPY